MATIINKTLQGDMLELRIKIPMDDRPDNTSSSRNTRLRHRGINYSAFEAGGTQYYVGDPRDGGRRGLRANYDFDLPDQAGLDFLLETGVNSVRLPFRMNRILPTPMQGFDQTNFDHLLNVINFFQNHNIVTRLDMHDYGSMRYYLTDSEQLIKYLTVNHEHDVWFLDAWSRLANYFKDSDLIEFHLMNEVNSGQITAQNWASLQIEACNRIRHEGFEGKVTVGTTNWQSIDSVASQLPLYQDLYGDPRYGMEAHIYIDNGQQGDEGSVDLNKIETKIETAAQACRLANMNLDIGETGISHPSQGGAEGWAFGASRWLDKIESHGDIIESYHLWGFGEWFGNHYHYLLSHRNYTGVPTPIMQTAYPYFQRNAL